MKKVGNKKGILLTEILIAMVLIVLIVVGGFQAVKSWKDSTHLHNTVKTAIQHIPAALDQSMVNKSKSADQIKIVDIKKLTSHADKTSWGGSISDCGTVVANQMCLTFALPDGDIAIDFNAALAKSTGSNKAISSSSVSTLNVEIIYER